MPTYPMEYMDVEAKEAGTRTFFVRYQEQTEVLEEAVKFRFDMDLLQGSQHWGDEVLLTFQLYHISKEDLEKTPTESYHRVLDSGGAPSYEMYSDKVSKLIEDEVRKAKQKPLSIRHNNTKYTIQFERSATEELTITEHSADNATPIVVKKRPRIIPLNTFQKVASKVIPVKNVLLVHSEFVPVAWSEWFSASLQCVVHCCPVSVEYRGDTTPGQDPTSGASRASVASVAFSASPRDYTVSSVGFLAYLTKHAKSHINLDDLILPSIEPDTTTDLPTTGTQSPTNEKGAEQLASALQGMGAVLSYLVYTFFHMEFWMDELSEAWNHSAEAKEARERRPQEHVDPLLFALRKSEHAKQKRRSNSRPAGGATTDSPVEEASLAAGAIRRRSSIHLDPPGSPTARRFMVKMRERVSQLNRRNSMMCVAAAAAAADTPDGEFNGIAIPGLQFDASPTRGRQVGGSAFDAPEGSPRGSPRRGRPGSMSCGSPIEVPRDYEAVERELSALANTILPVCDRVAHLLGLDHPAAVNTCTDVDLFDEVIAKSVLTVTPNGDVAARALPAKKRITESEMHFEILPLSVCLNQFNQVHHVHTDPADEVEDLMDSDGFESPRSTVTPYHSVIRKKRRLRRSVAKVTEDVTRQLLKLMTEEVVRCAQAKELSGTGPPTGNVTMTWTALEEAYHDAFKTYTAKIVSDVQRLWERMVLRQFLRSSSYFLLVLKKRFWRTEMERAKRHFTIAPDKFEDDKPQEATSSTKYQVNDATAESSASRPSSAASLNLIARKAVSAVRPATVPPTVPLPFTYPKHTFVEFQLLCNGEARRGNLGMRCDTLGLSGLPADTELRAPHPQHPELFEHHNSLRVSSNGDARIHAEHDTCEPGGTDDELFDSMKGVAVRKEGKLRSLHLIVFCHGYKGNQYDLRSLRNHMALSLSKGVEFLMIHSVEDHADQPIEKLGSLLATEVVEYIKAEKVRLRRLSFIGHSMGGIVIRSALLCPELEPYLKYLYTYVSLSAPHLGVADAESVKVSGALWVLSYLRQSANIRQLRLDAPGMHNLCCNDKIGLFKNVILISSEDDNYVTQQSATVDPATCATLQKKEKKLKVVEDMLRSLSMHLAMCHTVLRFNVKFHPIGRQELSTAMERAVGKAVHVAFLSNADFIHSFVCLFRQYFV